MAERVIYLDILTEEQQLATETCPDAGAVIVKARENYYDPQTCLKCGVFKARFDPNLKTLSVKGSCPKL